MAYTTYAYLHISDQRFDILRNRMDFSKIARDYNFLDHSMQFSKNNSDGMACWSSAKETKDKGVQKIEQTRECKETLERYSWKYKYIYIEIIKNLYTFHPSIVNAFNLNTV